MKCNCSRFGDESLFPVLQNVKSQNVMITTNVVASDIPQVLLTYLQVFLLRKSMIKGNMTLNFKNDHEVIFDQPIQLLLTKLGHYATSINPFQTIGNNINPGVNTNVTLVATENNL